MLAFKILGESRFSRKLKTSTKCKISLVNTKLLGSQRLTKKFHRLEISHIRRYKILKNHRFSIFLGHKESNLFVVNNKLQQESVLTQILFNLNLYDFSKTKEIKF